MFRKYSHISARSDLSTTQLHSELRDNAHINIYLPVLRVDALNTKCFPNSLVKGLDVNFHG